MDITDAVFNLNEAIEAVRGVITAGVNDHENLTNEGRTQHGLIATMPSELQLVIAKYKPELDEMEG